MSSSLSELCAWKIAEYIENGIYENVDYQLPEAPSNVICEILSTTSGLNTNVANEIWKKFNITNVILGSSESLDDYHCPMIFSKHIRHLKLLGLHHSKICRIVRRDGIQIDIIEMLKWMLNSDSCKALEHLLMDARRVSFKFGPWITDLTTLLPSLNSFTLYGTQLSDTEFHQLSSTAKNLTQLDVSHTLISNLTGISALTNLEIFFIRNSYIGQGDGVEELFELKKLRLLDVSSIHLRDQLVRHIFKCEKAFPELTFINCARNLFEQQMAQLFVSLQPKLKKIGFLGTCVQDKPDNFFKTMNPNVTFLTFGSFRNCLQSLEHHIEESKLKMHTVDSTLYKEIRDSILLFIENGSVEDYKECLQLMIVLEKEDLTPDNFITECWIVKVLSHVSRQCMALLTYCEKQEMVKLLITLSTDGNPEEEVRETAFELLQQFELLSVCHRNADELFNLVREALKLPADRANNHLHCTKIMLHLVKTTPRTCVARWSQDTDLKVALLKRLENGPDEEMYLTLQIFYKLFFSKEFIESDEDLVAMLINKLMRCIELFHDEFIRLEMMLVLRKTVESIDVLAEEIFEQGFHANWYRMIRHASNPKLTRAANIIMATVFLRFECIYSKETLETLVHEYAAFSEKYKKDPAAAMDEEYKNGKITSDFVIYISGL